MKERGESCLCVLVSLNIWGWLVLLSTYISIELRKRVISTRIWPISLCGSEAWTLSKNVAEKLEAFEIWYYTRVIQ